MSLKRLSAGGRRCESTTTTQTYKRIQEHAVSPAPKRTHFKLMLLHSPLNAPPLISCRSFSLIWNQPVGQNVHEGPVRLRPPARRVSLLRVLYRCHSPRRSAPWEEPDVLRQRDHSGRQQERHWQQVSRATGQKTLRSRHNSQHN